MALMALSLEKALNGSFVKRSHGRFRKGWGIYLGLFMLSTLGLKNGDLIPSFSISNQDGKIVQISDFKGHPVILFFYPKDETSGCTKEVCSFRDRFAEFKKNGAVVLGVSRQAASSHKKFQSHYQLPFDLLVDSDGSLAKSLGVDTIPIIGLHKRQTLLIDKTGRLFKFYENVDPEQHVSQILEDLKVVLSQ
jgi:peroxiredoxin Q/BCP